MLFKLTDDFEKLKAVPFVNFSGHERLEKHLEGLLSRYLFGTLFERMRLLPFHQERSYQAEADIYALNQAGEIVIFELKRATAGIEALDQLFRYTQDAGRWTYEAIDQKFRAYAGQDRGDIGVAEAHRSAFDLAERLKPEEFNQAQHMCVVGSAADENLMAGVAYWRNRGISIEFFPYRIYDIRGEHYFEFFAKPDDAHSNPGDVKGVLFDTNRSFDPDSLKQMVEKRRISAYGDRKEAVYSLTTNDIVFYSHVGVGLVAAARVAGRTVKSDGEDELYWNVEFLTPVPKQFDPPERAMPFRKVKEVTGKSFYWARIQKVPYLTREEAEHLLQELQKCLTEQERETEPLR